VSRCEVLDGAARQKKGMGQGLWRKMGKEGGGCESRNIGRFVCEV